MHSTIPTPPQDLPAKATHIAQLEALVEAQNMELEALRSANEVMAQTAEYLRILSHQMRTPLGTILASVGLMEASPRDTVGLAELAEYSGFITAAVRRLDTMAESACLLGCLNGGHFPAQRHHSMSQDSIRGEAPKSLEQVMHAALALALAQNQASSARPVEMRGVVPELKLAARAAAITEICLTQLFSNAIKFHSRRHQPDAGRCREMARGEPGGKVPQVCEVATQAQVPQQQQNFTSTEGTQPVPILAEVTVTANGEQCCIRVRDKGIGLSDDIRTRLFTPFRRGANARNIPGEGMGLYTARRCVQLLGGTLELVNAECAPAVSAPESSPLEEKGPGVLARLQFPIARVKASPE